MALSSLCLFFMFTSVVVLAKASEKDCTEPIWCGDRKFDVRFPFRVRDRQPNNCGYPGFDLSCTEHGQLALVTPSTPIKLVVAYMVYENSEVLVLDPEPQWFQKKPNLKELLNLSGSPFQLMNVFSRVTLLNCSRHSSLYYGDYINCISDSAQSYDICAISSESQVENNVGLLDCTKMYDYDAPVDPGDDSRSLLGPFSLTWLKPDCKSCERQQKGCRLKKNGFEHETECFNRFNYKHRKGSWIKIIVTSGSIVSSFIVLVMFVATYYAYSLDKIEKENRLRIKKFLEDYIALKPSRYSYADIKKITNQFKDKLGQGAYGTVFKGTLSNEILVAVKILNTTKGNGEEFLNEVATMGQIHHVNVVRLVGYCADGFRRALVYEFLPNDSLEKYISHPANETKYSLSWERLQDIALGTARGIEYLHQGCNQRILHFDIKPHNILLDQNFSPKISDFGLAKLCSKDQSIVSMSTARGTMGYIAPEVYSRNLANVSYKADVYSFGMLLLELVGGKKINTGTKEDNGAHEIYYPEWIYNLLEEGEDLRIQIEEEEDAEIAKKLAIVGLWCIQWHPVSRPTMKVVVQMLEGGEELAMPPNPFASTGASKTNEKNPRRHGPLELEAIAE